MKERGCFGGIFFAGRQNRRLFMILLVIVMCAVVTGCSSKTEQRELCLRIGYRTATAYLQKDEPGAVLTDDRVSLAESGEKDSSIVGNLVCGTFERNGREIKFYCRGTKPGEDPVAATYVSELRDDRAKEILEYLCQTLPASYTPTAVKAGRKAYLPVKAFLDNDHKEATQKTIDGLQYYEYSDYNEEIFAFECIPAGLTVDTLSDDTVQPPFMKWDSRYAGEPQPAEDTAPDDGEIYEDVRNIIPTEHYDPEQYIQSELRLQEYSRYQGATWRDQLLLEVQLTDIDFPEKEAELIAWVKSIGVAGVTFYDKSGECWTIYCRTAHELKLLPPELSHWFLYPTIEVIPGGIPADAALLGDAHYYSAETLRRVEFVYSEQNRTVRARVCE